MERIMSRKTNDTSKLGIEDVEAPTLDLGGASTFTVRELRDDELQKVSGGTIFKFHDLLISSY
jgi:bacteriocin-like protein